MFPIVTDMPACWDCNGRGHIWDLNDDDDAEKAVCPTCKGRKQLSVAEWKATLELRCQENRMKP